MSAGTAAATLTGALPAVSYGRVLGANDTIRIGVIGLGRRGRSLAADLRDNHPDARIVALSDVYRPNVDYASARLPEADAHVDFRAVLERSDVDAVVVATPDHWHALQTILACRAGKDVYVEKPASRTIVEGRAMVEAARADDRIVQVGTQQRSEPHFREAVELVRSGQLGPISFVRTWNYDNVHPSGIGRPPDQEPPSDLDWDLWLGPAPWKPYNPNRFGVSLDADDRYTRWATFRYFWDYGGGYMTDWGVHLLDIVQWAIEEPHPVQVDATGGSFHLRDNRQTPDTLSVSYRYPDCLVTYENRLCNGWSPEVRSYGIQFHGTDGTLFVDRSGWELTPEDGSPLEPRAQQGRGTGSHMDDFLESVRTRERPVSDIENGHRSTSTCLLGNVAYRSGSTIEWDGERETVVGDPEARDLLSYAYRSPWQLEL